jgi:hypothetical protein
MNFFKKLLGMGVSETASAIGNVIADVKNAHLSKREAELKVQEILAVADSDKHKAYMAELDTQKGVMMAELQQDDPYTKRTRPMLMRQGFYLIAIDIMAHVIMEAVGRTVPVTELELWFMGLWGGLLGVYTIGRSGEKIGAASKIISKITGNKNDGSNIRYR